jgi:aromatic ring-opening dioxygenase catalytic subunit (LigB family)
MAQIVGAFAVPHTPFFPWRVETEGPNCQTAQLFAEVRKRFDAARPDLVIIFDTDHMNTFFFDNLPIFAVGVADRFKGPNDEPRGGMKVYDIPSHAALATHIRREGVDAGFDLSLLQEFSVDHSVAVPLYFLTPDFRTPTIPIFISGHVPPLPKARRCFQLGQAVRRAVEAWAEPLRVAIVGTGSFSLEVWGPKIKRGTSDGVPAPEWVTQVCQYLENDQIDALIEAATEERMLAAGSAGGELLNVIAMLGTIDNKVPDFIAPEMAHGHAYGVWRGN